MTHRILVVDDSTTIQKVVKIAFAKFDVEVVASGSLIEAMSEINRVRPSAILADGNLPGAHTPEDFLSLARGVPLILLVGSFEVIDEDGFKSKGLTRIVRKPFESRDIVQAVENCLGQPLAEGQGAAQRPMEHATHAADDVPPPPSPRPDPSQLRKTVAIDLDAEAGRFDADDGPFSLQPTTDEPDDLDAPSSGMERIPVEPRRRGEKAFSIDDEPEIAPWQGQPEYAADAEDEGPGIFAPPPPPSRRTNGREDTKRSTYEETPLGSGYQEFPIEPEPIRTGKTSRASTATPPPPRQSPPAAASSEIFDPQWISDEIRRQLEDLVEKELAVLVREAVERYSAKHFNDLAREIILREIRRLTEERARHLVDT